MNHLFNEEFNLLDFLKSYYRQNLLVGAVEAGWPTESVGRSLIMWIAWILFNNGTSHHHRPPGRIKLEADKKGLDVPKPKKRKMNDSSYSGLTSLQLRNTISTMVHGRSMISH
jgi:hypothetical protein